MELILFIGIPGSGKSSFFKKRFFNSHIRVNLDMLRTRYRENKLLEFCFMTSMPCVIDNTNVTAKERKRYIDLAKDNRFRVSGYVFKADVRRSVILNRLRVGKEKIPEVGIFSKKKYMQDPIFEEGFDELYYVEMTENFEFSVETVQI